MKDDVRQYWERHPNAATLGHGHDPNSREFFEAIERHRYTAEPCIQEMAEFERWGGRLVLEVGCGMGTDLRQFSRARANVVGIDLTWSGIRMAKRSFELFGLQGDFVVADAEALPFSARTFDLVYSNGVIHHTPDTPAAVREIYRVTKAAGEARVMVYHRHSYFAKVWVGLMVMPILRVLLWLFPKGRLPAIVTSRIPAGLDNLYQVVARIGCSYEKVLTLCTDPSLPGEGNANPLSRVYSRREADKLFGSFRSRSIFVRQLYHAGFLPAFLHRWLERRVGWFLFVRAVK